MFASERLFSDELTFKSVCLRFLAMWSFRVSLLSMCIPKYVIYVDCGIWMGSFLKLKLTSSVLVLLILIFHFFSLICNGSGDCRILDALIGSSWLYRVRRCLLFLILGKSDECRTTDVQNIQNSNRRIKEIVGEIYIQEHSHEENDVRQIFQEEQRV